MLTMLPGTTIELEINEWAKADRVFSPMFLSGGLVLSQVASLTGLEPYVIQNWVRRGFLPPPVGKKYSRRQLSRILIINMLRGSMQMERICRLLSYINGKLDSEADDSIDDTKLYLYLTRLCAEAENGGEPDYDEALADYIEPFPGAKKRIRQVLRIMVVIYKAEALKRHAEDLSADLDL